MATKAPAAKTGAAKAAKANNTKAPPSEVPGWRLAMAAANKQFGAGSVQLMSEMPVTIVPVFSSGLASLDLALGRGVPRGRVIELYGPESSGKTTLALQILAAAQRALPEVPCAYIDAEHVIDPTWALSLGVDWESLLFSQPDYGEQAVEILLLMARVGGIPLVVVDSVAALVPKVELEGNVTDANMGAQAKLMSKCLRMLVGVAATSGTTVIFINQLREKVGVFFGCLRGDVVVPFVDGTNATMRDIVQQQISKQVWAAGPDGRVRPAAITNWFDNGRVDSPSDFVHIKAETISNGHVRSDVCLTPEHEVLTNEEGWVPAKNLDPDQHTLVSRHADKPVRIVSVGPAKDNHNPEQLGRYDLEIDGSGSFLVGNAHNGFVVHNSPEVTPGGRALRFYASVRMDVRRESGGTLKDGEEIIGAKTRIKLVKNKTAPPFRVAELELYYKGGFSRASSLVAAAKTLSILQEDGSHQFRWEGEVLAKGQPALVKTLNENPDLMANLSQACNDVISAVPPDAVQETNDVGGLDTIKPMLEDIERAMAEEPVDALAEELSSDEDGNSASPSQEYTFAVRDHLLAHSGQAFAVQDIAQAVELDVDDVAVACQRLLRGKMVVQPTDDLWMWKA